VVNRRENLGDLAILSSLETGTPHSGFYPRQGTLRLMSASRTGFSQWHVVVTQQAAALFQPAAWSFAVSLFVPLGLTGLVVFLFARRWTRRRFKTGGRHFIKIDKD